MSLSVIVASAGRPLLARAVASVVDQLRPGDELLVDVNDDAPWGHAARDRQMDRARGKWVVFMDDDDVYVSDALDIVRRGIAERPGRWHMFRMQYADGRVLWAEQTVACGNVSTQMVVAPANVNARWGRRYEGDFDFITAVHAEFGEPVWHEPVIALIRP